MARGLNKVMLIGNLGKDPEMKYTQQGTPITTFSIAVSRSRKSPDGQFIDETEWFRIVAWERLAEQCNEFLRKGSKVYIEGRLQTRSWEKDGQTQYMTEVVANEMLILDSRQQGAPGGQQGGYNGDRGGDRNDRGDRSDRYERQPQASQRPGSSPSSTFDDPDMDVDDIPF
jgi:single-strand DNA-binding protein